MPVVEIVRIVGGSSSSVLTLWAFGNTAVLLPVLELLFNLLTTKTPVQIFEITMVRIRIDNVSQLVDGRSCHEPRRDRVLCSSKPLSSSESVSCSLSRRSLS